MSFMDKFSGDATTSISSNNYAQGGDQNCGNVITGRSTTRIHQAPGGASQICFGDEPTPAPARPVDSIEEAVAKVDLQPEVADEPEMIPYDSSDYKGLTLGELRVCLRERGLNPGGGKNTLYERLTDGVESGQIAPFMKKNPALMSAESRPSSSSNNYARVDGQNSGNFLTERNSSRVLSVPGGASSVILGSDPCAPHISDYKRKELTGHNIFSEQAEKVRSPLGGIRKAPGGGSSVVIG